MQPSIEFPGWTAHPRRWAREAPVAAERDGPKIAFNLLLLFLLLLYSNIAVIFESMEAYRPAQVIAVAGLLMMVIELGQLRRSFKLMWPESAMVIAFLGACVISTPMSIYARHAVEQTLDLAKIVLVYVLLENVVTNEKRLRTVMFTMVIGGMFPALGTIDHYRSGIFVEHTRAAWRGLFGNPNEDAYGLLILIPLAMALARTSRRLVRMALWAAIATYVLAIFLTFSRGGLIALFIVLAAIGWKERSAVIKTVMAVGLVGGLIVMALFWTRSSGDLSNINQDTTVRQRLATFEAGGLMFINNPLLGVGPGDSMVAYPLYVPKAAHCGCQDQLIIHNSFLQVLSETGLLGFVPFVTLIVGSLYHAAKMGKGPLGSYAVALEVAMVGFVACSLSGGFTYTWWPYILVGLIVAAKRINDAHGPVVAGNIVQT
jgi:O-antigen ligase